MAPNEGRFLRAWIFMNSLVSGSSYKRRFYFDIVIGKFYKAHASNDILARLVCLMQCLENYLY